MRLKTLAARDFRNLKLVQLDTDSRFVMFHGPNAQGKTNALEAVWLLATLKPLRGHRLADLIGWGGESARVEGTIEVEGVKHVHTVELGGGPATLGVTRV